jgi:hypothetical protein
MKLNKLTVVLATLALASLCFAQRLHAHAAHGSDGGAVVAR